MFTSFQKRFFKADPGFVWPARRSWPRFKSSACFLLRSARSPNCEAAGTGAEGGGPAVVLGSGLAAARRLVWKP